MRTSRGFRAPAVDTRPGLSSADSKTKRTAPATRAQTPLMPPPAGAVDAGAGAADAKADAAGAAGGGKAPAVPALVTGDWPPAMSGREGQVY